MIRIYYWPQQLRDCRARWCYDQQSW